MPNEIQEQLLNSCYIVWVEHYFSIHLGDNIKIQNNPLQVAAYVPLGTQRYPFKEQDNNNYMPWHKCN